MKYRIDSLDEAGEHAGLYKETDGGGYVLAVEGVPSDLSGDVSRLKNSLDSERSAHKETKNKFSGVDLTAGEIQALRDEAEDLRYQMENAPKRDESNIEERAELLAGRRTREMDRELAQLREDKTSYMQAIELHEAAASQRLMRDAALDAISGKDGVKLVDSAREDLLPFVERSFAVNEMGEIVSKDGVGLEPGMSIKEILNDLQASGRRAHWFEGNTSAGASGGASAGQSGDNPFKAETRNMTEASRLVNNDPARAKAMIRAAGENPSRYGL